MKPYPDSGVSVHTALYNIHHHQAAQLLAVNNPTGKATWITETSITKRFMQNIGKRTASMAAAYAPTGCLTNDPKTTHIAQLVAFGQTVYREERQVAESGSD
ncbi:hypothetical protein QC763_0094730 [Podospora pseudopauciseta]|uniref:Uncharacterized protein n=2 Tax=Podospora TaxID=5144 RepID=A0ABR0H4T4_9PEZI|nr:hypothetical protein QC763_0094730 [Podospora pseudopauciseta]KAK4671389.1 hypothetical protein QC764_0094740 [Podospora pseudoanserina]